MSKQVKELTGANYYVGTEHEIKLMAKKINELVNQVNELTEAVNALIKQRVEEEE